MNKNKSYFATEEDYHFFNNGTFSKILIDFDCLLKKIDENTYHTADNAKEAFKELQNMGYDLYLIEVPEQQEILNALDSEFNYPFCCNDYPTRYDDLSDHWNTVSRNVETSLSTEGESSKIGKVILPVQNCPHVIKVIKPFYKIFKSGFYISVCLCISLILHLRLFFSSPFSDTEQDLLQFGNHSSCTRIYRQPFITI